MTEKEAKQKLFDIRLEYMMHTPKEREELYEEYLKKRGEIKKELARLMRERIEKESKIK